MVDRFGDRHQRITTRQLRENLAEVFKFVERNNRVLLTKHGEDRAGMVPIQDVMVLDALPGNVRQLILAALDEGETNPKLQTAAGIKLFRFMVLNCLQTSKVGSASK